MRTMIQHIKNLWDTMKAVLRGKFIVLSPFKKRMKSQQLNNLTLQLKALEKEEQNNSKSSRWQEIIIIRGEINEIETKETIEKTDITNSWFFEKVNKIGKPLDRLTKRRREKTQITKIHDEKGNIMTDNTEIHTMMRNSFQNLYSNNIESTEDIDNFLETYAPPRRTYTI